MAALDEQSPPPVPSEPDDDETIFALSPEPPDVEHQQRFDEALLGSDFSMSTRFTRGDIGGGQEIVFDQDQVPIGIRNVREMPVRGHVEPVDYVRPDVDPELVRPGGYVNPNVAQWYYRESYGIKLKKSWVCENVPWLFGPDGLYPDIYECPDIECDEDDPFCVCPM